MAEQDFLNYASDDGGNVSVPRRLRTRQDSSEVELAYITPEEAGILATLRPGSPHRGPMEVPSYDDFDAQGNYRSGAAMSAAESSGPQNERMRADLRQAGISPQEAAGIRGGAAAAAAMGQRGSGNFFGNIGGGIRNIGGGIRNIFGNMGNKLGAWAGKMRGGINPATGEYYTQDEYKDNVQARRDRARIDRLRQTRDVGKYANDPRGWEASDLSGRLAGFEKDLGITGVANNINYPREVEVAEERIFPMKKPDQGFSGEGFMTKEQYDAAEVPEVYQGPEVIPTTWSERVGQGLEVDLQEAGALKIDPSKKGMGWLDQPIDWETAGAMGAGNRSKELMMNKWPNMTWKEASERARKNQLPSSYTFALNPALKELDYGGKEGPFYGGVMGEVEPQFETLVGGRGRGFLNIADPELKGSYLENLETGGYYDEPYEDYIRKNYPKTLTGHEGTRSPGLIKEDKWGRGVATGGFIRKGYNTGGRVGILSIF